jgi:hypothetical protein
MEKTTIQLTSNTLERLKSLRVMERQSYDDLLNNLIDNFQEDEILTEQELKEIQQGLDDIKHGRVYSIESVAKELGIALR